MAKLGKNSNELIKEALKDTYMLRLYNIEPHDGDTVHCDVDHGNYEYHKRQSIRLAGIDCPEITGPAKKIGLAIRDLVADLFEEADGPFWVRSLEKKDGFGRILGDITISNHTYSLVQFLLDEGLAIPYSPRKKRKSKFTAKQLKEMKSILIGLGYMPI